MPASLSVLLGIFKYHQARHQKQRSARGYTQGWVCTTTSTEQNAKGWCLLLELVKYEPVTGPHNCETAKVIWLNGCNSDSQWSSENSESPARSVLSEDAKAKPANWTWSCMQINALPLRCSLHLKLGLIEDILQRFSWTKVREKCDKNLIMRNSIRIRDQLWGTCLIVLNLTYFCAYSINYW